MTASSPPTARGRETLEALEQAARTVIARKGFLNTTIADIAQEAGRSTASFYNYFDSKEALLLHWATEFQKEASERARPAYQTGRSNRQRVYLATKGHFDTYSARLAEMVGVFQLAMINDEFAARWRELCEIAIEGIAQMVVRAQRDGYCPGADPRLIAEIIVSMLNQFSYDRLLRDGTHATDEEVRALADVWYRAIFWKP